MLISWGLILHKDNILKTNKKKHTIATHWEFRRDVNGKAGFHCSSQKCHISKGQKNVHNQHGKKRLVWNSWNKEPATIAKVKEDLMLLTYWVHIKTQAEDMGVPMGGITGLRFNCFFTGTYQLLPSLYFLSIHFHTEWPPAVPFLKHFASCPPF